MVTIISVANQKGGAGKTTTAINVAAALATSLVTVRLIDTDPQATLMRWNQLRIRKGATPFDIVSVPEGTLEEELESIRRQGSKTNQQTIVIIDCPGNIQGITQSAVSASDGVICPVRATHFDFEATKGLAKIVELVQREHPETRFMMFISAKHASRNIDKGARENLVRLFAKHKNTTVMDTEIPDAAVLAEFGGSGQTIFEYAPKSAAARIYKKLTKEIVQCLSNSATA